MTHIELLTRPGCHLCDTARQTVASVAANYGADVDELDISGDVELTAKYGEEIPVVLIDGRVHTYWRVDAGRLSSALEAARTKGGAEDGTH